MLKFLKQLLKFVKEWFLCLGAVFLGSVCLVIAGVIGEAYFGWAVFPGSEGHVPILKFILLLLGVLIAVVTPFVGLVAIWALWKGRKLLIKMKGIIDEIYFLIYSDIPDECIKDTLRGFLRSEGLGQDEQGDPAPQDKGFLGSIADMLQGRPEDDTSDPTSREPSSDAKPDF